MKNFGIGLRAFVCPWNPWRCADLLRLHADSLAVGRSPATYPNRLLSAFEVTSDAPVQHYQRRALVHDHHHDHHRHHHHHDYGQQSLREQIMQCIPHYVAYKDYYERVSILFSVCSWPKCTSIRITRYLQSAGRAQKGLFIGTSLSQLRFSKFPICFQSSFSFQLYWSTLRIPKSYLFGLVRN